MLSAALLNGIHAHYIELDDGHRFGMLHPGVPVISALLSVAAERGLSSEAFLRGLIVGYEATIRLAMAIQPGHKLKGFHATATCGTMGAALGLASALSIGREKWNTVLSCAATDASGLLQLIDDSSELKPYNAGRAAACAINAAFYGSTGVPGPEDVLGGKRGFFAVTAGELNEERLLNGFMPQYAIRTIYRKPYAACRHTHAVVEAVLRLREEHGLKAEDAERIRIRTYGLAIRGHEHTEIRGEASAKMSMPYSAAAALKYGRVNFQQYSPECLADDELKRLMERVEIAEDPELSALVPEKRAAVVTIESGTESFSCRVDYPKGEPENPVSAEELKDKFFSLTEAAGIDEKRRSSIYDAVMKLEEGTDTLFSLL